MNDPKYKGCLVRDGGIIFCNIEADVPIDRILRQGQFSANELKQDIKLYIGGELVKTFQPDGSTMNDKHKIS